jgi:hypothetical protein
MSGQRESNPQPFLFKDPVSLTRSSVLAQILAQPAVSPTNLEEQNGFPHQTYTPAYSD